MNTAYRKPLEGTPYSFFDARAAVDAITPGAYDQLPYTSKVLAENLSADGSQRRTRFSAKTFEV